jgi:hypothetical protein
MTLVDLVRKLGKVELSLEFDDPEKPVLKVARGGREALVQADVVQFATGGSVVLVHAVPENPTTSV